MRNIVTADVGFLFLCICCLKAAGIYGLYYVVFLFGSRWLNYGAWSSDILLSLTLEMEFLQSVWPKSVMLPLAFAKDYEGERRSRRVAQFGLCRQRRDLMAVHFQVSELSCAFMWNRWASPWVSPTLCSPCVPELGVVVKLHQTGHGALTADSLLHFCGWGILKENIKKSWFARLCINWEESLGSLKFDIWEMLRTEPPVVFNA